jgi:hypothetical protein
MLIGISARIRDKRVDKVLKKHGFSGHEIFYSPILIWLFASLYLILIFCSVLFLFIFHFWYFTLIYLCVSYVVSAYFNNSFAITTEELVVVNPNFPFRRFEKFNLRLIEEIKVGQNKMLQFLPLFFIKSSNYVQVQSNGKKKRFYCSNLDLDAYDENLTEKTLYDFRDCLLKNNIIVTSNLK